MKRTWDQMCEMLEEQAKKIERLEKAFEKYGKHKEDCDAGCLLGAMIDAECTCGFRKALKDE